jgi:sterol desaturase/sphingolipid hydroxylase (fatty acid hydroxylase superfamily)
VTVGPLFNAQLRLYLDTLLSVLLLTALFYPFERLRAAEPRQRFADRVLNYLYYPFALGWLFVLQLLLAPWHTRLIGWVGGGFLPDVRHGAGGEILFGVVFAVMWDIWQYWIHRAQHAWPALWETHKFHHSETSMNTSTQARHQWLSHVVYLASYAPMLLLFGARAPHVVATVLMFRVWGFVNHANVRIRFGPLTSVVAGPQWHRIHHSVEPEHLDRNFAAFFPMIDRLFGTYYAPAADEYPATGLTVTAAEAMTETPVMQATVGPLLNWYGGAKGRFRRAEPMIPIEGNAKAI